jgi:hypothetical protein
MEVSLDVWDFSTKRSCRFSFLALIEVSEEGAIICLCISSSSWIVYIAPTVLNANNERAA